MGRMGSRRPRHRSRRINPMSRQRAYIVLALTLTTVVAIYWALGGSLG